MLRGLVDVVGGVGEGVWSGTGVLKGGGARRLWWWPAFFFRVCLGAVEGERYSSEQEEGPAMHLTELSWCASTWYEVRNTPPPCSLVYSTKIVRVRAEANPAQKGGGAYTVSQPSKHSVKMRVRDERKQTGGQIGHPI